MLDLLRRRPEVRTAVLLADLPDGLGAELYRVLGCVQCLANARAGQAAQRRAERSAAIEAGIRRAVGATPFPRAMKCSAMFQVRIENSGPGFYGLHSVPHLTTIRAVLRKMNDERKAAIPASEPTPAAPEAV